MYAPCADRPCAMSQGRSDDGAMRPYQVGQWHVDPCAREISDGARRRRLSPRAMTALRFLAEAEGEVCTRAELMRAVWPDVIVGDESLTTAISELRRALASNAGGGRASAVETVPKSGYRLVLPVTREASAAFLGEGPSASEDFNLEAYLNVLQARRLRERGMSPSYDEAEALSLEATGMAPGFALGHAQLAFARCASHLYRGGGGDIAAALASAERARRLRPDIAFTHAAEGYALMLARSLDKARAALAQAITRDPNDFDSHLIAACAFFTMGDWRAATTVGERAALLNADDVQTLGLAARAAEALGDKERAMLLAARGLQRAETRLAADPGEPRSLCAVAAFHAMRGDMDLAAKTVGWQPGCGAAVEFHEAIALARIGEKDYALDRLEAVIDCGWRHGILLMAEPLLANLHSETRFTRLADKLAA